MKPLNRRLGTQCLAALTLSVPLMAAQADELSTENVTVRQLNSTQTAKLSQIKQQIKSASAQHAAVDEKGRLRPVEHDELRADEAAQKSKAAVQRNATTATIASQGTRRVMYSSTGAKGIGFDPDNLSFASVKVGQQGKLEASCDEGDGHDHQAHVQQTSVKGAK